MGVLQRLPCPSSPNVRNELNRERYELLQEGSNRPPNRDIGYGGDSGSLTRAGSSLTFWSRCGCTENNGVLNRRFTVVRVLSRG